MYKNEIIMELLIIVLSIIGVLQLCLLIFNFRRKDNLKLVKIISLQYIDVFLNLLINANNNAELIVSKKGELDNVRLIKKNNEKKWWIEINTECENFRENLVNISGMINPINVYFEDDSTTEINKIKNYISKMIKIDFEEPIYLTAKNLKCSIEVGKEIVRL